MIQAATESLRNVPVVVNEYEHKHVELHTASPFARNFLSVVLPPYIIETINHCRHICCLYGKYLVEYNVI